MTLLFFVSELTNFAIVFNKKAHPRMVAHPCNPSSGAEGHHTVSGQPKLQERPFSDVFVDVAGRWLLGKKLAEGVRILI